jgi:hypothetical protein
MAKWKERDQTPADDETRAFQKQDAEFCARLRVAIKNGDESSSLHVKIEPSTKRPVVGQRMEKRLMLVARLCFREQHSANSRYALSQGHDRSNGG